MPEDFKSIIVAILNNKQQIGMTHDLCCYMSPDGFYCVDYVLSDETVDLLDLTDQQRQVIMEEEDLIEIFETPEEAAEFYLKLTKGKLSLQTNGVNGDKKRTIKEKLVTSEKDQYF